MAKNTKPAPDQITPAFDLFRKSKKLIMQNSNTFAALYFLPLVYTLTSVFNRPERITNSDNSLSFENLSAAGALGLIGLGAAVAAITAVINIVIQLMLIIAEYEVSRNKKPNLSQLWQATKKYGLRLIGLGIAFAFLFVGGLILLIYPGLIVLRRYFLSPYYLIDKDLTITEALRQSAKDSKPFASDIWGVIGVFILLSLISIIPIFGSIISFVLVALYSVAPALRYKEIKQATKSS